MLDTTRIWAGGEAAGSELAAYAPPKITPVLEWSRPLVRLRAGIDNAVANVPEAAYHEPILKRRRGFHTVGYVTDPDILEEMLVRRWRDFPKTTIERRVFKPFLGAGLLTSDGDDWRWKRRLAAPAFSPAALGAMAPALSGPFDTLAEAWSAAPRAENVVDVDAAMAQATLRVIERILFSMSDELDLDAVVTATADILAATNWMALGGLLRAPEWLPFPGRRRQRAAIALVRGMVGAVVRRRRAELDAGAPSTGDLTSALLRARDPESGRPLSDDDMADMLITLIFAGHETSAHTLSWALYCLAHQPELQERIAVEADAAARSGALQSGDLTATPLAEAAVKETLRLFPVAPIMARACEKPERFGDVSLPAGSICMAAIYVLHRRPADWERPDVFDVERWARDPNPRRTLYMPFGAGPRVCVGGRLAMMETTLGLAALLRRVRFEPCAETVCDPVLRVTLRPRDGLMLRVVPRR